jgi:hypothetical protein
MNARVLMVPLVVVAVLLPPLATVRNVIAQPGCLHGAGEDAQERSRRGAAIRLVRGINTAEANGPRRNGGKYQPLTQLGLESIAVPGFEPQFTTDGETYALILRDTTDPCGFTVSTNQRGVVFQGYPIDYEVQPVMR